MIGRSSTFVGNHFPSRVQPDQIRGEGDERVWRRWKISTVLKAVEDYPYFLGKADRLEQYRAELEEPAEQIPQEAQPLKKPEIEKVSRETLLERLLADNSEARELITAVNDLTTAIDNNSHEIRHLTQTLTRKV